MSDPVSFSHSVSQGMTLTIHLLLPTGYNTITSTQHDKSLGTLIVEDSVVSCSVQGGDSQAAPCPALMERERGDFTCLVQTEVAL